MDNIRLLLVFDRNLSKTGRLLLPVPTAFPQRELTAHNYDLGELIKGGQDFHGDSICRVMFRC